MMTRDYIDRSMSYTNYRKLLQDLLAQGKTTGGNQSEAYINYGKINVQRMSRLHKTIALSPELQETLKKISGSYLWVILTEGWCGDASQSLPVMAMIETACTQIELKLLLRDENLDLMDQYLTNTGRSIPKLICVEKESLKEIFTWGPRPEAAQALMLALKAKGVSYEEKSLAIQKWYNNDRTQSVQNELLGLIQRRLLR